MVERTGAGDEGSGSGRCALCRKDSRRRGSHPWATRLGSSVSEGHLIWCCRRPADGKQESTGLLHLMVRASRRVIKKKPTRMSRFLFYGAGDEARTRYLHLGKVALYRMSYARNEQNEL